jgi:hypothetical protein
MTAMAMPHPRRHARPAALAPLLALAAAGCGDDGPSAPAVGGLAGVVTVVGDRLPDGGTGGELYVLRSPDAPKSDAVHREPLQGGPRAYAFALDAVAPGTYYLEACLRFAAGSGCAPYTTGAGGNATAVVVQRGRVTRVVLSF